MVSANVRIVPPWSMTAHETCCACNQQLAAGVTRNRHETPIAFRRIEVGTASRQSPPVAVPTPIPVARHARQRPCRSVSGPARGRLCLLSVSGGLMSAKPSSAKLLAAKPKPANRLSVCIFSKAMAAHRDGRFLWPFSLVSRQLAEQGHDVTKGERHATSHADRLRSTNL